MGGRLGYLGIVDPSGCTVAAVAVLSAPVADPRGCVKALARALMRVCGTLVTAIARIALGAEAFFAKACGADVHAFAPIAIAACRLSRLEGAHMPVLAHLARDRRGVPVCKSRDRPESVSSVESFLYLLPFF